MRLAPKAFAIASVLLACGEPPAAPVGRPCVDADADALRRMRARFHLAEADTAGFTPSPARVDLDHDGRDDRIYTFELGGASLTVVYAMRDACGEPMGEIDGSVTVLRTANRNFSDLRVDQGASWKVCRVGEKGDVCGEP